MQIKAKTITYEFTPEDIKKLIAQELKIDPKKVDVQYRIEEVGGDPMDRYPGHDEVVAINVTVNDK